MEYKVHVDAGKEDCYWQYVHPGATLYVSYQVLKGGDGAIGMAVRYFHFFIFSFDGQLVTRFLVEKLLIYSLCMSVSQSVTLWEKCDFLGDFNAINDCNDVS